MFGFTNIGNRADHAIATFLRKHGAAGTWTRIGHSNQWRASKDDKVVLVCFYSGPGGMITTYWVPDELAEEAKRLAVPVETASC